MKRVLLLAGICALASSALAQALTNDDIVELFAGGLSPDSIVLYIGRNEAQFDTSPDALLELKRQGLPDNVIDAMITAGSAVSPPSADEGRAAVRPSNPETWLDAPDFDVLPPTVAVTRGGQYYTRFTIYYEDNHYYTTNYKRHDHLPINSLVEVRRLGSSSMQLRIVDSGEVLTVQNVSQYSRRTMQEFADLMLSEEPTRIELYGEEMAEFIRQGELRLGMTKTQVLLARGYPPGHRTESTELDRWVFWSSRFINRTLVFEDGRLVEGRDII